MPLAHKTCTTSGASPITAMKTKTLKNVAWRSQIVRMRRFIVSSNRVDIERHRRPLVSVLCLSMTGSSVAYVSVAYAYQANDPGSSRCDLPLPPRNLRINLFSIAHIKPAQRVLLWR
jgi:hypothetical protein